MKRKMVFRVCKWIGIGAAILLLFVGLLFGLAQTEMGKKKLALWLGRALTRDSQVKVELEGLDGFIPFHVSLDRLTLSDAGGVWLEVNGFVLRWSPTSLFRRRIHIHELRAEALRLDRVPKRPKERQDRGRIALPTWPPGFLALTLEQVSIQRVVLGESVAGMAMGFALQGEMSADDMTGLLGAFHLERIDGPKALATLSWTLRGRDPDLSVRGRVEEAEEGVFATLLGLKGMGPLTIDLSGEGPVRDWHGHLSAQLGGAGWLEATIGLAVQEDLTLTAEGDFQIPPPLVPEVLVVLTGITRGRFSMEVSYRSAKELVVHRATLRTQRFDFSLTGRFDIRRQQVQGQWVMGVQDLTPLESMAGTPVRGRLRVEGDVSGPVGQPRADLHVSVEKAGVGAFHATTVACNFHLEPLGPIIAPFPGLSIRGKGSVDGLTHRSGLELPETRFQWSVVGRLGKGSVSIEDLKVEGKDLSVEARCQLDPTKSALSGRAHIEIEDLNRISGLVGKTLSGGLLLATTFEGNWQSRSFLASVEGKLSEPISLPPVIVALLGPEITFVSDIELVRASELMIHSLKIDGAGIRLTGGEASIDLSNKELMGQCQVKLPDLSLMSHQLRQPLEGGAEIEVGVSGTLSAPRLMVRATGRDIRLKRLGFQKVGLTLRAENLRDAPQGDFEIDLQDGKNKVQGVGGFLLDGNRLSFSRLVVTAPGMEIAGNLGFDFQTIGIEGSLKGRFTDFSLMSAYFGEKADGKAWFEAKLSTSNGGQIVGLEIRGREVLTRFATFKELELNLDLSDAFGTPTGVGKLRIRDLSRNGLVVDSLELKTSGTFQRDLQKINFSGFAKGRYKEPFEMESSGALNLSKKDGRLTLDRLQGRYGVYDYALQQTAVVGWSGEGYGLEGFALTLGPGRMKAWGRFSAKMVDLAAGFEGLPLEALRLIGAFDLTGTASGQIRLVGPGDDPEGHVTLRCKGIRLRQEVLQELPPATLAVDAELRAGVVRATASLGGLTQKPVKAEVRCPVVLSLSPLDFSLPPEGEIYGRILAVLNLSHILSFFPVDDQSLEGVASIDLSLAGAIGHSTIVGFCRIEKATYENVRTGTILKEIQVEILPRDRRLLIKEARATDGEEGEISVRGWFDVDPGNSFPFQLDVHLNKAKLLRQDEVTATLGGDLVLSGSLREPLLAGQIVVSPAEVRIPDRMPPEIVELEVVEINMPDQTAESRPIPQQGRPHKTHLDLQVEFPGRMFVRGRGLDAEWRGLLQILGPVHEPAITGSLSLVRGHFNLFGKRLVLTQGSVQFDGAIPPNPNFDVTAENRRAEMTARIRLTGTPSALIIELESDPPMPPDEILSHLLFGRDVVDITPVQAVRLTAALNALTGAGGGILDVMEQTRKFVRLDQLDIKPPEDDTDEISVSAGKYLMEGVYVEVEKGMTTDSGAVSVEIEITPNITIESEAGADAQAGIGLNWIWSY